MPRDNMDFRETDRRYTKFKSKRIKREKKRGNTAAAERHATELLQYLGLDGSSELPIERALNRSEELDDSVVETAKLQAVRNGALEMNE